MEIETDTKNVSFYLNKGQDREVGWNTNGNRHHDSGLRKRMGGYGNTGSQSVSIYRSSVVSAQNRELARWERGVLETLPSRLPPVPWTSLGSWKGKQCPFLVWTKVNKQTKNLSESQPKSLLEESLYNGKSKLGHLLTRHYLISKCLEEKPRESRS